jgi:hypothetical protein
MKIVSSNDFSLRRGIAASSDTAMRAGTANCSYTLAKRLIMTVLSVENKERAFSYYHCSASFSRAVMYPYTTKIMAAPTLQVSHSDYF